MKNILLVLLAFGLAVSAYAVTVTNRGEVVVVTTLADVIAATGDTNEVTLTVLPPNVILVQDTALTLADAQAYTGVPGQLLISVNSATTTGFVYMASGFGTNWFLLK